MDFILEKSDTLSVFEALCRRVQQEKGENIGKVIRLRSDHGREFENISFANFCDEEGIAHEFSAPITPQQNGIVERKNQTLQEMARVMLLAKDTPSHFWAEAINTACHIHNRVTLRSGTSVTLYEIWRGRKPNVKYFHVFGSTCYILVDREPRRKLDPKSDEGIFLGYSRNSRAFRVFNKWTRTMMESINVVVDDENSEQLNDEEDILPTPNVRQDVTDNVCNIDSDGESNFGPDEEVTSTSEPKTPSRRIQKNHPVQNVIGDINDGVQTRRKAPEHY